MIKKLGQKTFNCFNIITMIDLFTQAIPISENWFRVTIRQTYVTMRSTTNVYQAVQRAQWSPSLILAYYLISPMVWRSVVTPYQWEVVRHPASSFVLLLVYIWDALSMTCSYRRRRKRTFNVKCDYIVGTIQDCRILSSMLEHDSIIIEFNRQKLTTSQIVYSMSNTRMYHPTVKLVSWGQSWANSIHQ